MRMRVPALLVHMIYSMIRVYCCQDYQEVMEDIHSGHVTAVGRPQSRSMLPGLGQYPRRRRTVALPHPGGAAAQGLQDVGSWSQVSHNSGSSP